MASFVSRLTRLRWANSVFSTQSRLFVCTWPKSTFALNFIAELLMASTMWTVLASLETFRCRDVASAKCCLHTVAATDFYFVFDITLPTELFVSISHGDESHDVINTFSVRCNVWIMATWWRWKEKPKKPKNVICGERRRDKLQQPKKLKTRIQPNHISATNVQCCIVRSEDRSFLVRLCSVAMAELHHDSWIEIDKQTERNSKCC